MNRIVLTFIALIASMLLLPLTVSAQGMGAAAPGGAAAAPTAPAPIGPSIQNVTTPGAGGDAGCARQQHPPPPPPQPPVLREANWNQPTARN